MLGILSTGGLLVGGVCLLLLLLLLMLLIWRMLRNTGGFCMYQ